MKLMTVKELISQLQGIEDKDEEVIIYYSGDRNLKGSGDRASVEFIEDLGGRKILNCTNLE